MEIFETGQPFHNAPLICIRLRPNVRSATFILRQQQQRHAQEQQEEEEAIAAAAAEVQVQSDRDREGGGKKSKLSGVAKEGAAHTTSPISTSTSNSSSNGRSDSEAGEDTDTSSSFAVGISSVWSRLRALISPSPTHPNNQESKHEEQRVGQVAQHITETTTAAKKSYEKRLELQNISKQLVLGQHGNAKNVGGGAYPGDYCYNNDDIKNLMRNAYKEIAILCKLEFHPCIPRVHSAYLEGLWGPNEEDKDEEDKGGQEEEKEEKKKEEEEEEEKKKHEQGRGKRKSQTLVHPQRNMSGKALDKSSNDQKQHAQIQTRSLDFGHGYGQLKPHRQCPPLSYILPRINNGTKLFIIQEYLNGGDMFEAVDRWIRIAYIKKLR